MRSDDNIVQGAGVAATSQVDNTGVVNQETDNKKLVVGVSGDSPVMADDSELIEDEWVAIIKRILIENRDDPYLLSRAMTILRADYLKKRYQKDIKIPD
jgi:hypothetical protein